MQNNVTYNEFEQIMDIIGDEISLFSKKHKTCLLYSGGMDSTAMLLSLLNAKAYFTLVHVKDIHPITSYALFREYMAKEIINQYSLPFWSPECHDENDFYKIICKKFSFVIDGDGMDRMYFQYYTKEAKTKHFTFGEPFRAFHPFLDMFFAFAPSRLSSFGIPTNHKIGDIWYNKGTKFAQEANITFIKYSYHPLMLDFFSRYKEDVGDIFFRKDFTYRYIKMKAGKTYNQMVKEVCKKNKLESNVRRLFKYLTK